MSSSELYNHLRFITSCDGCPARSTSECTRGENCSEVFARWAEQEVNQKTNRDKYLEELESMSDDELSNVYCNTHDCKECPVNGQEHCYDKIVEWLKQTS